MADELKETIIDQVKNGVAVQMKLHRNSNVTVHDISKSELMLIVRDNPQQGPRYFKVKISESL